jgi:hypothetical protein
MTLDRAILLPREFNKKDDDPPVEDRDIGVAELMRSPTKNTVEFSQKSDGRVEEIEKS